CVPPDARSGENRERGCPLDITLVGDDAGIIRIRLEDRHPQIEPYMLVALHDELFRRHESFLMRTFFRPIEEKLLDARAETHAIVEMKLIIEANSSPPVRSPSQGYSFSI